MAKQNSVALAAAKKASGSQKKVLSLFHLTQNDTSVEYYIEAKNGNTWRTVLGPYTDFSKANKDAQNYAHNNHVATRVVGFD